MDFSTATILITGGNSGIGRGFAEALSARGAKVIVTGRNSTSLKATLDANPGIVGYELDVTDPEAVLSFANAVTDAHSDLNAVIHNAGIMLAEDVAHGGLDLGIVERTIATNLLGPIRLTSALLPHLRSKPKAAIVTVSSGLAFVPLALTPTYSATKAAIHSWSQSMRYQLRSTNIEVVEIAPPMVATELMAGQSANPRSMPLDDYINEATDLLCQPDTPDEVLVERVMVLRGAERTGNFDTVFSHLNPA
ncbi:MAG: SDR family NAD(P)-dependent oxidoreductase [Rhizobiaceae bacterium]|nr:SDR family NAD(P)-dependent oxidoreductase [Rhizobiaceae bacterium]